MSRRSQVSTIIAGLIAFAGAAGGGALAESAGADATAQLTPALAAELAQNANRQVIVLMKNKQLTGADAANDRAPVMSELQQVGAQRIKTFHLLNAFAAVVSDGELQRLKANPSVAEVAPDVLIRRPRAAAQSATSTSASSASVATSLPLHNIPGACATSGQGWIGEELEVTNTDSNGANPNTARALGFTGKGVKVAYIADGVDPRNENFIRSDGTSVFFDYQDFTGDGPGRATDGGEAFVDSNAIAGQGRVIYNVQNFGTQATPGPCLVRIEGVAPGASIAGYDTFGTYEDELTSGFLEAIEYAVTVDQVDVLNESFGNNPFPDVTAIDVTKQFNDAAVDAGVVVTVSSGDAGIFNTEGSAATDPKVIAVGASTIYRFNAQTNYGAARYFATSGWLDDNISSFSSGGFDATGQTVDLVAPGEQSYASCDKSPLFSGCVNFRSDETQSSNIEESGGTSESAPLTAGAAALVIEAYRKGHFGASPTPAIVKQILTSTATDLGTPASEQGAGLLNTYKAVLLAQSIGNGALLGAVGGPVGQTLLFSSNQLTEIAAPGTPHTWGVTVTNSGTSAQSITLSGRTFGPDRNVQRGSVTLTDGANPQFQNWIGLQTNYATFRFQVPDGQDRLTAEIAYQAPAGAFASGNLNARVRLILIDPTGRFAAHSVPQGSGNFGSVEVREPVAGTWTGVIYGIVASQGGTNSPVPWRVATEQFVSFGSVSPSTLKLAPFRSETVQITATTPATPGDAAGAIVVSASGNGSDPYVGTERDTIPVTLRSLISLADGGTFSGVATGGNGRGNYGQENFYEFDVGPGHESIMANVTLANDPTNPVGLYLVNPDGVAVGYGQNTDSVSGTAGLAATAYALNPVPGRWTLIVDFAEPITGNEISETFTGNIRLDATWAQAQGLPNNPFIHLPAGEPLVVPVLIKNTGAGSADFFIDARLNTLANLSLAAQYPPATAAGYTLPLGTSAGFPYFTMPTETSSVQAVANATLPIEFDFAGPAGDPDLFGAPVPRGKLAGKYPYFAEGSYAPAGGVVSQGGVWDVAPDEIGPFPGPAPSGYVNVTMTATTKAFDPTVTSTTGDWWLTALDPSYSYELLEVAPGADGIIVVTITPKGVSGQVVSGTLYVNHATLDVPPYGAFTADEVIGLPYSYTIQ
jgi:hypothetical protein